MVKHLYSRSQMEQSNHPKENQVLRTSTFIRDNPDREEEQGNLLGESDGSSPPLQDSSPDDGDARNDFWSISGNYIYRHHVESRVKLYVPRDESFLNPLKYIDVTRATRTSLYVMLEKIDVSWNVDGDREFSDRGQVSPGSRYWMKNHRMDIHGPEADWQGNKRPPDQTLCGQKFGKTCQKRREKQNWAIEKPKLDNAWKLRGICFIDPADEELIQGDYEKCA